MNRRKVIGTIKFLGLMLLRALCLPVSLIITPIYAKKYNMSTKAIWKYSHNTCKILYWYFTYTQEEHLEEIEEFRRQSLDIMHLR